VDAQLPPALAGWLREAGHDSDVWRHVVAPNAVLITTDEDFCAMVSSDSLHPRVVWLRIGNCTYRALQAWFLPQLPHIVGLLEGGAGLVEVR